MADLRNGGPPEWRTQILRTTILDEVRFPTGVRKRQQSGDDGVCRPHIKLVRLGGVYESRLSSWSDTTRGGVQWWSSGLRSSVVGQPTAAGLVVVVAVDEYDGGRARPDRTPQPRLSAATAATAAWQPPRHADLLTGFGRQRPSAAVKQWII